MEQIKLQARAKINIALDVVGKRPDGYNNLRSVMQTIALSDTVIVKKVYKDNYLKLVANTHFLPTDARNLAYKAAQLMITKFGLKEGVFIGLEKRIPVAAGLAGGSSDCAATLVGIRKLFNIDISDTELMNIGLSLGADVPFCIAQGTMLAEGVGEILTPLPHFPEAWILLAKPNISVSTADVFKAFKPAAAFKPDIDGIIRCIEQSNLAKLCSLMGNALESVTIAKYPIINRLKEHMAKNGALGALMSGSGPTVFGVFASRKDVFRCRDSLRAAFPEIKEMIITRIYNV